MKFSLVMATLGRADEIGHYLASLSAQTHRDFELIVVDQNRDDRLVPFLERYRTEFPIIHLRSEPGVSRARNAGLEEITGEVVGFPDDDCWYPVDLLERTARFLEDHPNIDGVTGRAVDETGADFARFDKSPGTLTLYNAFKRSITFCAFFRSSVVAGMGGFDESLGPGAGTIWGAGEDNDFPLSAIEKGFEIYYNPQLVAFHLSTLRHGYLEAAERAYNYGAGFGRVWRKHNVPVWLVAYYLLRPFGGALLSLAGGRKDKARYHWRAFRGRLKGWFS